MGKKVIAQGGVSRKDDDYFGRFLNMHLGKMQYRGLKIALGLGLAGAMVFFGISLINIGGSIAIATALSGSSILSFGYVASLPSFNTFVLALIILVIVVILFKLTRKRK